jgi:hypothetical protein
MLGLLIASSCSVLVSASSEMKSVGVIVEHVLEQSNLASPRHRTEFSDRTEENDEEH